MAVNRKRPRPVKVPLLRDVFEQRSQSRKIRDLDRLVAELARRGS